MFSRQLEMDLHDKPSSSIEMPSIEASANVTNGVADGGSRTGESDVLEFCLISVIY